MFCKYDLPFSQERAVDLATDQEVLSHFNSKSSESSEMKSTLPIVPNYLRHPALGHRVEVTANGTSPHDGSAAKQRRLLSEWEPPSQQTNQGYTILKLRIAKDDPDFIETELEHSNQSMEGLLQVIEKEFKIGADDISRIRKLPNTRLRRDIEVKRLENYQELEVVKKE